ncbi:class I SAM-dependent methyltransferase [Geobacter sp. AOG1]|uniref:class I SAM-dependent methyltransferase n=1 Tax=Geobacter sp. AOG1 TaxID=1566346 RepID=UPI001CC787A3|nr:class I SAM-dependent methyltransferase [Geobacter sp. AOG1]
MGKYEGHFLRCLSCGFLFADNPIWLDEANSTAINVTDLGLVGRNIWFANIARSVVFYLFDSNGKFLDYGGGTGLFTRLMRDAGYDWYWYDKFCLNIFAEGFSADMGSGLRYELLTAAELFEHLVDPVQTLSELNNLSENILFTTQLLPENPPRLDAWWYYGLEHGQHVSFFSRKSLQILAESSGLIMKSNGNNLHLFCRKNMPNLLFKFVTNPFLCGITALLHRRSSLLSSDYEIMRNSKRVVDANRT